MNPDFTTSFNIDFVFERTQRFKLEVRDADNTTGTEYELVGTCEFELGQLVGSRENLLFLHLAHINDALYNGKGNRGSVVVRCEKKSQVIDNINIQFSGHEMTAFGIFSSITPVLILWKPIMPPDLQTQYMNNPNYFDEIPLKSCQWVKIWESIPMKGNHCVFPPTRFDSSKLCGGNYEFPIKVRNQKPLANS